MAAGSQWKHLELSLPLSKCSFSLLNLNTFPYALLSTYWLLRTRKHKANRYFRTLCLDDQTFLRYFQLMFLTGCFSSFKTSLINTKLEDSVNLGVLFLTVDQ